MLDCASETASSDKSESSESIARIVSSAIPSSLITVALSETAKVALTDNNTTESKINEISKLFPLIIPPHLIYIK